MKNKTIGGSILSLLLTTGSFGSARSTQETRVTTENRITIRIHDYARANPSVLLQAEEVAKDILQQAGVATVWIECSVDSSESGNGACPSPLSPLDFVVNLLPREGSDRLHLPGGVLGIAAQSSSKDFGFAAYAFYDAAGDYAKRHQQDWSRLLGVVIAHELGHLLLGTDSHSGAGLMCASWSPKQLHIADQGGLKFSDAEAKQIQAAITLRTLAASARGELLNVAHGSAHESMNSPSSSIDSRVF